MGNGFAGRPAMRGLGRHYEVLVRCRGETDPVTGYLLNIQEIDKAVRATVVAPIARACEERAWEEPAAVLRESLGPLDSALGGRLVSVRWRLSPYYSLEMTPKKPDRVILRQQFDFAASHRLHTPALSDEENRRLYGKCNNEHGHGHNYRIEPAVSVELDAAVGGSPRMAFTLQDLERLTGEAVIQRFDHTHLNEDTREFGVGSVGRVGGGNAEIGALNPSVENIAKVCFELLAAAIDTASGGRASLRTVTVWETDRTSSTYPAE